MKKSRYEIHINAPVEKVWEIMLGEDTYKDWTSVFCPGSYYKGNWNIGSKIVFLGIDPETNKEGGMVSSIKENRLHEFVSIEHLGFIEDGIEDTTSEKVKGLFPAYENYTFVENNGGTDLIVEIDILEDYEQMFDDLWPKSLEKLKEIVEKN